MESTFQFSDYSDILDDYYDSDHGDEIELLPDENGNILIVKSFRLMIPSIGASFREGLWFVEDDDEPQDSVYVWYKLDEKDPQKYIAFYNSSMFAVVLDVCASGGFGTDVDDIEELECYLEEDD